MVRLTLYSPGTEISEGLPFDRISAIDPENDPLEYLIPVNSINSQYFNISATTGALFFRQQLDRDVSVYRAS